MPTSSPGPYPPTSIGGDSYSKLPLSGAPGFSTEPQELPLQASMAPSVPLPLTASEQSQPSLRSQYSYTTSAPQLSGSNVTIGGGDNAFSMPRYVDNNPRPSKSPRQSGHQSVHSSGSITNTDTSSDYRYGSYRAGASDASQAPSYTSESSATTSAPSRDYYPSSNTWTTSAAEPSSSLAYAGTDARSYSFSHESYKSAASTIPPLKHETPYSGAPRGSFDTMSNYSWSAA